MISWLHRNLCPVQLTLPLSPSLNGMFKPIGRARHIQSEQYREWITEAGWELQAQRPPKIDGAYDAAIFVNPKMRGDIDNRIKATLDLLVKHGVTADDSKANSIGIERIGCIKPGTMLVCAEPAKFDRPLDEMMADAGLSIPSTPKNKATGNAE
jgi:Holliday junction resolvase RusA-like endonuclease